MDADRFDARSRTLSITPSRRGALRGLAGAVCTSLVGGLLVQQTDAHDALLTCKKLKGERKRKCRKKAKKHNAAHANETPLPPGPTCSDGVKNGSESDVDCGGSCQRCTNGKRCTTGKDCLSGLCAIDGTCQDCLGDCLNGCPCINSVCASAAEGTPTPDCNCPEGTATCGLIGSTGEYSCLPYCER